MTTIYIVTSGQYSDYGINAVFDSKEKAQAFIDYEKSRKNNPWYSDEFDIEEWELNQFYDPISRGLTCYQVVFTNINIGDGKVSSLGAYDEPDKSYTNSRTGITNYGTVVWATDEQSALKIANERRVQRLVNEEVPEEPDKEK